MVSVAPKPIAASRFEASGSMAMMRDAPATRAPWITDVPTPPQPITATVAPGVTCAVLSAAPNPVVNPQPISASWSDGRSVSTGMHDASWQIISSAKLPTPLIALAVDPSARRTRCVPRTVGHSSHRWVSWRRQYQHWLHTGVRAMITRCPARTRLTSLPVHTTSPQPSWPRIIGLPPGMRWITARSEWHTPLACTFTTTSRGPGSMGVTSSNDRSAFFSTNRAARMPGSSLGRSGPHGNPKYPAWPTMPVPRRLRGKVAQWS